MKRNGEFHGIRWLAFDRQREKRRREYVLKYALEPGNWKQSTAPKEVTSDAKCATWIKAKLQELLDLGEPETVTRGKVTVGALYEQWILLREQNRDLAGVTVKGNRTHFRAHILPAWGETRTQWFDSREGRHALRVWVRDLAPKLSVVGCRNICSTFTTFFRDVNLEGLVQLRANPMESDEVRDVIPEEDEANVVVTMPVEVVQRGLLDPTEGTDLRNRVRYALAVNAGPNNGELCGLQVKHVLRIDTDRPALEIRQAYKLSGKREAGPDGKRGSALGKTKNKFRVRTVPLNACAAAAVREWLDYGWEEFVGRPWEPTDPLLPSSVGNYSWPRIPIREDLERAGQPTKDADGNPFEFRALRRTFSTLLRAAKVDVETRERLMGQSSSSVNVRHYTGEVPEELYDAVSRLPFVWSAVDTQVAPLGGTTPEFEETPLQTTGSRSFRQAQAETAHEGRGGFDAASVAPGADDAGGLGESVPFATKDFGSDGEAEAFYHAVAEDRERAQAADLVARPIRKAEGDPPSSRRARGGGS